MYSLLLRIGSIRSLFKRAGGGNRTRYLLITSQLLYQVSYTSKPPPTMGCE